VVGGGGDRYTPAKKGRVALAPPRPGCLNPNQTTFIGAQVVVFPL